MSLRDYVRKRQFDQTPEPAAGGKGRRAREPIFVVQLHHARARHYDFRLEADGALKSWAVPKGPSLRPGEQRLAVEVEDHPIAYARFAGDIPEGHYGAGHVDIFDRGTWEPEEGDPLRAIAAGKLDFQLHGEHLRGRWTLVRTRRAGSKQQWLLIKRSDEEARDAEADDFLDKDQRKATVQWMRKHGQEAQAEAIAAARPSQPPPRKSATKAATRKRAARKPRARDVQLRKQALALEGARDTPLPVGFPVQLAMQKERPPAGDDWLH
jgi:bifunctional non-homologous end joining protein LigD